jgi:hypothetical protein
VRSTGLCLWCWEGVPTSEGPEAFSGNVRVGATSNGEWTLLWCFQSLYSQIMRAIETTHVDQDVVRKAPHHCVVVSLICYYKKHHKTSFGAGGS